MRFPVFKVACLLIVLRLFPLLLQAQQYNFRGYTVQDGLPQSSVFSMLQDSRGYLWLGTLGGGVARFDGENFVTFDVNNGLAGNMVRCLYEDAAGYLWFGTEKGLSIYDGYAFYSIGPEDGLLGDQVLSIYQSSGNELWVGTDQGLNRLVESGDSVVITPFGTDQGLGTGLIFDIEEDRRGRLWLATYQEGILMISVEGNIITGIESVAAGELPARTILDLEKDENGNFWVATGQAGVCHIRTSVQGGSPEIICYGTEEGLHDITVYDLEIDHRGQVWVATGAGGLHRISGGRVDHYGEDQGAPSNQILTVIEDRYHQIWAGSNDAGFFMMLGDHFIHFTEARELSHNVVTGIVQNGENRYFLSTYGGGLGEISMEDENYHFRWFGLEEGLPDLFLNGLSAAPDGTLWIATNDRGLVRFDGNSFRTYTIYNGLISNRINTVCAASNGDVWCGTGSGICRFNGEGFFCITAEDEFGLINNTVNVIIEDRQGNVWAGTMDGLVRFTGNSMTDYDEEEGLDFKNINTLCEGPDGRIWIGTFGGGLYVYLPEQEGNSPVSCVSDREFLGSGNIFSLAFLNDTTLLVGLDRGFDKLTVAPGSSTVTRVRQYGPADGFVGMENNSNSIYAGMDGKVWFGTVHGLTLYDPAREEPSPDPAPPLLTDVRLQYQKVDWEQRGTDVTPWFPVPGRLALPYADNHLTFHFRSVSLANPQMLMYRHRLLYEDTVWSPPRAEAQVTYTSLDPGEYVLEVMAVNKAGRQSPEFLRYAFVIRPPFYQTWWFILGMVLLVLLLIMVYIRWREKKLVREKRELEEKVNERTREIRKQKNEIEEKNKILEKTYRQISHQKSEIEQKNRDITASIEYARRIQSAMLPAGKILDTCFDGYFIFYKPKDIVSGDFYWIRQKNGSLLLVAADCTGHGVPGAFMSMLGISFLDEIVDKENEEDPSRILNKLRENIIVSLKQGERESESKDGMDMAICRLDPSTRKLWFSGANNSLYLVKKGKLVELPADRMPVAIHERMDPFSLHTRQLEPGDCLYLFSDGYADQFGGPEGKKFKYRAFREMLLAGSTYPMDRQKELLEQNFRNWITGGTGDTLMYEQVDDILVMGCRVR
ncbi:MAG: two-component regulator propeller domain-containing protein [Bacteroidales bacterium]